MMTRLASTPIKPAMRGFSAVARMARPILVFSTISTRPIIAARARISSMIWVGEIRAPAMLTGVEGMICGNGSGLRPQIIMAKVCSRIDTPMAVISGARRGALRSGR